jgi:hypothetical protein
MSTRATSLIGAAGWIAFVLAARTMPTAPAWTPVLLTFAALVLVPLALDLVAERRDTGKIARAMRWARIAQLPAAALLTVACGMRPGLVSMLFAIPWAVVTALLASVGFGRLLRDTWARPLDRISADVGMIYLVIGGVWALADRGGLRPLRLDAAIVALTAVHFHFAGFLLPIFSGLVARQMQESRLAARAIVAVILGVPAVAIGITITQLGGSPTVEAAAGCGLALGGMVIGILHVRWALDTPLAPGTGRLGVGIAGISLFFAMVLAAAYSIRGFSTPLAWLGLPQMRALHGTLNAIGFGLCGALGWRLTQAAAQATVART